MPRSLTRARPNYEPGTAWKYEIDAAWESGELTPFNGTLDYSGADLQIGHTYRARVRMKDAAGRWSHWSSPAEFVVAPPAVVPTLVIHRAALQSEQSRASPIESDQEFIEILNVGDASR